MNDFYLIEFAWYNWIRQLEDFLFVLFFGPAVYFVLFCLSLSPTKKKKRCSIADTLAGPSPSIYTHNSSAAYIQQPRSILFFRSGRARVLCAMLSGESSLASLLLWVIGKECLRSWITKKETSDTTTTTTFLNPPPPPRLSQWIIFLFIFILNCCACASIWPTTSKMTSFLKVFFLLFSI